MRPVRPSPSDSADGYSDARAAAHPGFPDETLPFWSALVLAAAFFGFVAWDQSHWWRVKEDYGFGWLVPLLAGFVVYDRRARILAAVRTCSEPDSPRARGTVKWLLRLAVVGVLSGGAALFLLGAFYRAGAGPSQPGTLAITVGAIAFVLALIFLNAPEPAPGTAAAADGGRERSVGFSDARLRVTLLFLFPVVVWLLSAPIVSAVESQLNLFLLRQVVTVVAGVFDVLGLPIEQQGNVLVLPRGSVGVEDACAGIRSITGCLVAGSFLAAVFLDRGWKKGTLVVAALMLAFVANLARGLALTGWAYRHGPAAIGGAVHEVAGYAVLGLTVVGLVCLVPLFAHKPEIEAAPETTRPSDPEDGPGGTH